MGVRIMIKNKSDLPLSEVLRSAALAFGENGEPTTVFLSAGENDVSVKSVKTQNGWFFYVYSSKKDMGLGADTPLDNPK